MASDTHAGASDRSTAEAGALECNELEITPEMIDAGVGELCRYDPDYETESSAVERIFTAMVRVSREC